MSTATHPTANYKKGDWIHNSRLGLIAEVSGFDSNGVTVLLEGGNTTHGSDTAAIEDCHKIEHGSLIEMSIYEGFSLMYAALQRIQKSYDWQDDLAGEIAHNAIKIVDKI